jgi:hypothetical protein
MTTLKAHNRGCALGQEVDDFTLALVAPLGADDDYVLAQWPLLTSVTSGT